jgi:hypothetical protein
MASWIVRARGVKRQRFEAMDELIAAGFDVEVSPRGTHYVSPNEVVLVVWLRDTHLTAAEFEQRARDALFGVDFEVETSLLHD